MKGIVYIDMKVYDKIISRLNTVEIKHSTQMSSERTLNNISRQ